MFSGVVDWSVQRCDLARYAGDVDDRFGGGGGGIILRTGGEEVGESELGGADWVVEVDVEAGIAGGRWIVF